jgi:hypothetical protein
MSVLAPRTYGLLAGQMETGMQVELIAFPGIPHPDIAIRVEVERRKDVLELRYRLSGEAGDVLFPEPAMPVRTDGLWQHSCFELFVRPAGGDGYVEFNLAPSTRWAAYGFTGRRDGMADLPLARAPEIEPAPDGLRAAILVSDLPGGDWQVGLSAVIEERSGRKSWWALAHPGGASRCSRILPR